MGTNLSVEVIPTAALGTAERAVWDAIVRDTPRLHSPFFHFDYTRIAGEVAPGAEVAVLHRQGRIAGFLPFQRRGRSLQPIAAPLTDYHGLIIGSGEDIALDQVVRALHASSYRFNGLQSAVAPVGSATRTTLSADLSAGFDAYYDERKGLFGKYHKDKERAARSMERDHGAAEYTLADPSPELLDWVIAGKRAQFQRTGQYDVFACGWTRSLLQRLLEQGSPAFGGQIATLRLDGKVVAAEYSLRAGARHHFWFPVYDAAFGRYSPGALLSLNTMRTAAADGVTMADFGLDAEGYKKYYTAPSGTVFEGVLPTRSWRATTARCLDRALAQAPGRLAALPELRRKVERRFNVITACEASWTGVVAEAGTALGRAVLRRSPANA